MSRKQHNSYTDYLLLSLMEEAAELQKECAKALKFGLDKYDPREQCGSTNREKISCEFDHLLGTHRALQKHGALRPTRKAYIRAKLLKLVIWYDKSR